MKQMKNDKCLIIGKSRDGKSSAASEQKEF
jgi:hypothetical protein